ncbi:MAG TPA: hypothetical protein VEY91_01780 [Candidatus Limnocylindria bacterium]|nr:hypothetical protein [Candidatus Limnocylindria bacterium]
MPSRFLLPWALFALVASVHVSGCSLAGYGVGSVIDNARAVKLRPGERTQVFRLDPGARLAVHLADGTVVAGTYRGLLREPEPAYRQRYGAWRDTAAMSFRPPRIGEPVTINSRETRLLRARQHGTFLGFGPVSVHFLPRGKRTASSVPIRSLSWIADSSGARISGSAISEAGDRVPVQAVALIERDRALHRVDLLDDGITAIELGGPNRGFRNAGLLVGFAVDAAILVTAAANTRSSQTSCEPTYTGTPYYARAIPVRAASDSIYLLPLARAAVAR